MECTSPPSIPPPGAQRALRVGRCCLGGLQISSALHLENLAFRHQLGVLKQLKLSSADRFLWAWLCELLERLAICIGHRPTGTVISWHRNGFWTWTVRRGQPGRPPVAKDVRELICKMSRENPLWGAPHMLGELFKLAINVRETSVGKHIIRNRTPPLQAWRTFLDNHRQGHQYLASDASVGGGQ